MERLQRPERWCIARPDGSPSGVAALYTRRVQPPSRRSQPEEDGAPQLGLFSDRPWGESHSELEPLRNSKRVDSPPPEASDLAKSPQKAAEASVSVRSRKRSRPASGSSLPSWAYASGNPAIEPASQISRPAEQSLLAPAVEPRRETRRIWTVADLVGQVRANIEQTWADLWVHGEISNLRTAPSGHLYFTLKDGESQLPAVLFRRQAQLLRFRPEDGLEVLLRGKVSVYEQRGQMQLIAEHLEPVGAGSLQIAFEQLKARLAAEGLFEVGRKRELPSYPRCVGIVTSPAGAVIRDFLNVAGRRHAALDVLLYPAVVQGSSAAAEIAAGIAYFNAARNVDVIVIARGGGSLEDLAPFNTELLARAIAASALPVVSAVGHETDFTIADFVADLRAPTPSAAAELITAAQHRVEEQVSALEQRLGRACRYQLILARQRLGALPVETTCARLTESINRREQRVDALRFRMEAALRGLLHDASARVAQSSVAAALARLRGALGERGRLVESLRFRLQTANAQHLHRERERLQAATTALLRQDAGQRLKVLRSQWNALDARLVRVSLEHLRGPQNRYASLARQLDNLSPLTVLSRGYALVFDADGALVKRAADVSAGETLTLRLAEGTVRSRVEN
jgi:exodeoxyribonuclease VII large subunit